MPTTIRQVLCPTDFSETSRRAIAHATAVARWYGASLTVMHVCDSSGAMLGRVREQITASCAEATGSGVRLDVLVDSGRPATAIVDRAASMSADLIVIGTHGAGGFEQLVLGSVAEKVLRKAGCPVLTVPPHAEGSVLPFKQILCAVDFSVWSLRAFELAQSLSRESGAALTALSVIEWPWHEPPAPAFAELPPEQAAALAEYRRYVEQTAMRRLASLVEEPAAGIVAEPRVGHGKPAAEILQAATDLKADLIVIGVHGRSALDLRVFGSTANQVVRQAGCPVLTLKG